MSEQEIRYSHVAGEGGRTRVEHVTSTTEMVHVPEIVFDAFSGFARCDLWAPERRGASHWLFVQAGAVGYDVIAFPLAAGVFYPFVLSPEVAALSMSGSTLVVAINSLRLKRTKPAGSQSGKNAARPGRLAGKQPGGIKASLGAGKGAAASADVNF